MTSRPSLAGLRVLEIGDGWACALAGKLLLDAGARVTKVESSGGDSLRRFGRTPAECAAAFDLPNLGKVVIGTEALGEDMDVDVLLIDAAVATRLGLDLEVFGPRTVICRFAPFALDGPLRDRIANDLVLQAMSGVLDTTGEADGEPLRSGTELSDVVGALYGVVGVVAALIERERSGQGQIVDVALMDCLVSTLTNFASRVLAGAPALGRLGNQGPNSAPWELFETQDGEYVFIIAGSPPTFERLTRAMGRPDLNTDPRFAHPPTRRENYREITRIVNDWTRSLSRREVVDALRDNGVPVSPVDSIGDLLAEPHFQKREMLQTVVDPDGTIRRVAGGALGFRPGSVRPQVRAVQHRDPDGERGAPLAGVRVVDFGNLTACPFSTRLLGNLGADVLKIEPPQGETGRTMPTIVDGESTFFHISNTDKRSMCANLRDQGDVALVAQVLAAADIVVQNQAPGTLARRGLGPEDMLVAAPDLVYVSASGYGSDGPLGGLRAYDTVIQAGAGLMSLTGPKDGRPLKTGISSADVLGALACTSAGLIAYFGRMTGRHGGASLDVALFDICAWSTQMAWVTAGSDLGEATRQGNGHWLFAPYGIHATRDGRRVAIACEDDTAWQALVKVLDGQAVPCPEGAEAWDRATRWKHRDALGKLVDALCATQDPDTLVDLLQRAGIPSGPVMTVQDVLTAGQALAATVVEATNHAGRSFAVTDIPLRLSATPARIRTAGPELGAENATVRGNPNKTWESVFGK